MRTFLPFFACLMLVLTTWSGMVQAAEAAGCCERARAEISVHIESMPDRTPADSEKSCPYQHAGCHGHHVGVAIGTDAIAKPAFVSARVAPGLALAPTAYHHGPALRPPRT